MTLKILILGAGYGGLITALRLQGELNYNEAEIILINRHNYHYIATHLHQQAAGTINIKRIRINLDDLIDKQKINLIKSVVGEIDINEKKKIILKNGQKLTYDFLVIALGSEVATFGIKGLKEYAFSIRSVNSVQLIREHIEYMFAKYKTNDAKSEYLTFVVGGAGFTGIEFAGELADRIPSLCEEFGVDPDKVKIISIEAASNVLPGFDPKLVDYAVEVLTEKGVEFLMNTSIKECNENGVILQNGKEIKSHTVVWTGGVRGNDIVEKMGVDTDNARVKVNEYLQVPGFDNVFTIGDNSILYNENDEPYPPTAQIAIQQGEHVARLITSYIRNGEMDLKPFEFNYRGTIASLGKRYAIGNVGKWKLSGYTAVVLKNIVDNRYLYSIGGLPLVLKKGKFIR